VRRVADQAHPARMPSRHKQDVVQLEGTDHPLCCRNDVANPRRIPLMQRPHMLAQRRTLGTYCFYLRRAAVVKPPHLAGRCLERAEERTSTEHHDVHAGRNGNAPIVCDAAEIKET
jgi:hypothetical protein